MGNLRRRWGPSGPSTARHRPGWLIATVTLGILWAGGLPASAAGRVELELVTDRGAPLTAQQEWLRRLAQVGVSHVRIRSGGALDKVGIVVRGTESSPVYAVTGLITSGGEVLLPGGRYRPSEVGRLARWLEDLAKLGPPDQRPKKSAFGLTAEQFAGLHKKLSLRVGFSTQGMKRREALEKLSGKLLVPVRTDATLLRLIRDDDLVAEDLSSISCGTALACVVRPLGLCFVPRESGAGRLECVLVRAKPKMEAWPVGWKPEKHLRDVLPALFEFLNVNVDGVAVPKVLEAVSQRLKVPVLMDHNAMARHGIEPEKAMVSLPQRRTTYSLLLKRTLSQAGLKSELRVDEAGKPFFWVTTLKPL